MASTSRLPLPITPVVDSLQTGADDTLRTSFQGLRAASLLESSPFASEFICLITGVRWVVDLFLLAIMKVCERQLLTIFSVFHFTIPRQEPQPFLKEATQNPTD